MQLPRPLGAFAALHRNRGRLAPSPPPLEPLSGHLAGLRNDRLSYFLGVRNELGDVVRLRFGWVQAHLISHPDGVRHVLVDNARNYDKQTRGFEKLRTLLGNGLLTSEGAFWKRQRRIAQPAFSRDKVASFAPQMAAATDELVRGWGEEIDLGSEMMRLTLRIAGETLLSTNLIGEAAKVGEALTILLASFDESMLAPLSGLLQNLPTGQNRRIKAATKTLEDLVHQTIATRRASKERPHDLLTLLIEARDEETGDAMSDEQLRDEVMTMFLAGHETTANALTWTLILACRYPQEFERVIEEIDALQGRCPTAAEAAQLTATRKFFMESMRLYPPAWMIARHAVDDDEIGGFPIPKGGVVLVSPWVVHRHAGIFDDPERFDPNRFSPDRFADLPKNAYFPFGAGPRMCIGQPFAMLEAMMILVRIVQKTSLCLVAGQTIVPHPAITLRPSGKVRMTVSRRPSPT